MPHKPLQTYDRKMKRFVTTSESKAVTAEGISNNIDKIMPTVTTELTNRKIEECKAKGIPYVSPQEQQRAEIAKQQQEAEEARIKELKEKCVKKGLDFETENNKYLEKKAKKDAKKAKKKTKKD